MIDLPNPMEHRMRSLAIVLVLSTLFLGLGWRIAAQPPETPPINTLTEQDKKDGWKLLFDGKSFDNWRVFRKQDSGKWIIKEGLLISNGGIDIITKDQYANFEFQADWKVERGNNSGIIYRVSEEFGQTWLTGMEMQVEAHGPKDKVGKTGGGALYDVFAPKENHLKPITEWNTFKVVANGKHLEHWVNGFKVVECDIGSDEWNQAIANSKWKDVKSYASKARGHIALQDHGNRTAFRNIKIRVLPDGNTSDWVRVQNYAGNKRVFTDLGFVQTDPDVAQIPSKRPLVLDLQPVKEPFKSGTVPAFRLTIRNEGKVAEKVLKLRGDLQDTYFDLKVTKDGKPVNLPRAISDPGPITNDDYVTLQPGQKVTYDLTRFATALDRLSPGEYKATVRYWPPSEASEKSYHSPEAKFNIEK